MTLLYFALACLPLLVLWRVLDRWLVRAARRRAVNVVDLQRWKAARGDKRRQVGKRHGDAA